MTQTHGVMVHVFNRIFLKGVLERFEILGHPRPKTRQRGFTVVKSGNMVQYQCRTIPFAVECTLDDHSGIQDTWVAAVRCRTEISHSKFRRAWHTYCSATDPVKCVHRPRSCATSRGW